MKAPFKKYINILLVIIYTVGLISLFTPFKALSLSMTPVVLIITNIWMLLQTKMKWLPLLSVFSIGMLIEIIGVHTGYPFGNYHYTSALGFSLAGVPFLIGLNWILIPQLALSFTTKLPQLARVVLGAFTILFYDFLIEPLAINYGWWVWEDHMHTVPLLNYVTWFVMGLITTYLLLKNPIKEKANLQIIAYILFSFFILNNLIIRFF